MVLFIFFLSLLLSWGLLGMGRRKVGFGFPSLLSGYLDALRSSVFTKLSFRKGFLGGEYADLKLKALYNYLPRPTCGNEIKCCQEPFCVGAFGTDSFLARPRRKMFPVFSVAKGMEMVSHSGNVLSPSSPPPLPPSMSEFDVLSPMDAWAAENNPDDFVDDGLCLNLVGKNDTIFLFSGSLDSCLVWFAGMKSSISGLARSCQKSGKAVPGKLAKFLLTCFLPQVICASAAAIPYLFKMIRTAATWVASAFPRLSTLVGMFGIFSMSAGTINMLGAKLIRVAASQTSSAAAWNRFLKGNSAGVFTVGGSLALRDALLGVHCRYRHSSSRVEARHLISLPPLWLFCRFLLCVLSWLFPWDPGLSACSGTSDR